MSKYISDEKLREIVYDFDNMDLDLDKMVLELEEEHVFSDEHNKKMDALFETWEKEEKALNQAKMVKFKKNHRMYKMIASVFIIFLFGVSAFHIDTILVYANKLKHFVMEEFEEYSIVRVENEEVSMVGGQVDDFELNYESETFKMDDMIKMHAYKIYEYKNEHDEYIEITVSETDSNELVDTENAEIKEKEIEGVEYNIIVKDDLIQIYFVKNGFLYHIMTDISEDEIFEEIKKIK